MAIAQENLKKIIIVLIAIISVIAIIIISIIYSQNPADTKGFYETRCQFVETISYNSTCTNTIYCSNSNIWKYANDSSCDCIKCIKQKRKGGSPGGNPYCHCNYPCVKQYDIIEVIGFNYTFNHYVDIGYYVSSSCWFNPQTYKIVYNDPGNYTTTTDILFFILISLAIAIAIDFVIIGISFVIINKIYRVDLNVEEAEAGL